MDRPEFPSVDPVSIVNKLHALPLSGKQVAFKSRPPCMSCGRDARPIGRLLAPGCVTCSDIWCNYVPPGKVCELFPTPYRRAVRRSLLSVFCKVIELPPGRILVQRQPIIERAEILASAYKTLVDWQRAMDIWERYEDPDRYEMGIISIIPPTFLDDVLAIRATEMPTPMSPVEGMPEELQITLRRIVLKGEDALEMPF